MLETLSPLSVGHLVPTKCWTLPTDVIPFVWCGCDAARGRRCGIVLPLYGAIHVATAGGSHIFSVLPRRGELRTQKLKPHLVRTQSLNVLPLKPGVDQYIPIHLLPGNSSWLISTLLVHSLAFFPKPLLISPVLAVANTWFLCRPAE